MCLGCLGVSPLGQRDRRDKWDKKNTQPKLCACVKYYSKYYSKSALIVYIFPLTIVVSLVKVFFNLYEPASIWK